MKNLINWKLFFFLLIVCVAASMLVIPFSLALTPADAEISLLIIVVSAAANSLVLFAIAAFFGLLLSKHLTASFPSGQAGIAMGLPILEGLLKKENKVKEFKALLLPSIGLGVLAGVLIIVAAIPFNKAIPELSNANYVAPVAWKGFLASFYGGIAEEVLLRLFIMSLFVWITFKIKKSKDGCPTTVGILVSIILASVLFGIGHLPATAGVVELNVIVVIRAIVLNGIGGVIFGWLYWKKGLESAIISHFSADIVLHVITPLVLLFV
jgi:membrane protease YdiL (CAAX protease family)